MPSKTQADAIALPKAHAERLQFPKLIAKNPNHFGNFPGAQFQPALTLSNDVTYEELSCVGYNPDRQVLEAVIQIKQPTGYLGNECTPGSFEYVRFFADTGSGFQDVGLAAVNVHDIPDASDCAKQAEKPLSYAVSVPYAPPNAEDCDDPVLPLVRAILSWQTIPTGPNFPVTWGNRIECRIQLAPGPATIQDIIEDLIEAGIKIPQLAGKFAAIATVPIPGPDPEPLSIGQLATLYAAKPGAAAAAVVTAVPAHRFGFEEVQKVLSAPVVSPEIVNAKMFEFASLKLDWQKIIAALDEVDANVSFERLDCIALEGAPGFERLVATVRILQPAGYSGNLCTAGSLEYVAFWADWEDTCQFTYLGTTSLRVHDVPRPVGQDLCYNVVLPVDLSQHRASCETPRIARVRAVLSWAVPPSTTDPNALKTWGNLIDTHVQIQPGVVSNPLNPKISILGGIPTSEIDGVTGLTTLNARFAGNNLLADSLGRACPFGGVVEVQGLEFPGFKYRIQVRNLTTAGAFQTVATPLMLTRGDGTTYVSNPDGAGYFEYQQYVNNIENLLGNWFSAGDDQWQVKLEIADQLDNPVLGAIPDFHRVQLDNTAPDAAVHIDSAGDCGKFAVGAVLNGHFVARDANFGSFGLGTLPFASPVSPGSGTTQTAVTPGNAWSLNTAGMTPCGYDIHLSVADRSIVNSSFGSHNFASADTGFCLLAKL